MKEARITAEEHYPDVGVELYSWGLFPVYI
jgi:hypothetical protein